MKTTTSVVSIRAIPRRLDEAHQMAFCRELAACINVDRPKVILDCSALPRLELDSIYLLLCCLEEAMMRNGDVRLAALQPEALAVLRSTGLDRIFQAFEDVEEAVESFRTRRVTFEPALTSETGEDQMESSAA